jgi:hypothetical protein
MYRVKMVKKGYGRGEEIERLRVKAVFIHTEGS